MMHNESQKDQKLSLGTNTAQIISKRIRRCKHRSLSLIKKNVFIVDING